MDRGAGWRWACVREITAACGHVRSDVGVPWAWRSGEKPFPTMYNMRWKCSARRNATLPQRAPYGERDHDQSRGRRVMTHRGRDAEKDERPVRKKRKRAMPESRCSTHTTDEADPQPNQTLTNNPLQKTTFPQVELQKNILDGTQDDCMRHGSGGQRNERHRSTDRGRGKVRIATKSRRRGEGRRRSH